MKKIFFASILSLIFFGCGFKVVNNISAQNFNINEITTTGNARIDYLIKNKILLNSEKNERKLISINLNTVKKKNIKEKNIKNEITKYEINISTTVSFRLISETSTGEFILTKSGNYDVAKQFAETLNNERKLTRLLANDISKRILNELEFRLNDL